MFFINTIRNRIKFKKRLDDTRRGVFFFETPRGRVMRVDPLLTYAKLKEIGFDVMTERVERVMRGDPVAIREFGDAIQAAFGVRPFNGANSEGMTILDALRLYLGFYSFLAALKKNLFILREFAPSLEERLGYLQNASLKERSATSTSTPETSSSDSTSTSQTPPEPKGSESTTEPPEPSPDSTSTSTKPSTDETTSI